MRTASQVFDVVASELHTWRLGNPHAFVGAIIVVRDDGQDVHLRVRKDVDDVLGGLCGGAADVERIRAMVRDRMNDGVCPVLVFTADTGVHVSSYAWVAPFVQPPARSTTAS